MTKQIAVWVMVDSDGDYAVGIDADNAADNYDQEVNANSGRRLVKVLVTVPLPVPLEATATIEEEVEATATAS